MPTALCGNCGNHLALCFGDECKHLAQCGELTCVEHTPEVVPSYAVSPGGAAEPGPLPDLPAGVWRHYKGPLYLVLGYGHDSNNEGRSIVVYVGLQLDEAKPGPRLAVRTAADFHAEVSPGVKRFTYVGPDWRPE